MNTSIVPQLIKKDWQLNSKALFIYGLVGLLSLALLTVANTATFYVGAILLISIVITIGVHLVITTVVNERKEQTLALVMSLPISHMDYTKAKISANLICFAVPWLALAVSAMAIILSRGHIPNGLIPFAVILLLELFAAYVLVLSISLMTESEGWTIAAITVCNVCVSLFIFFISSIPGIGKHTQADAPVWNFSVISTISLELLFIITLIGITFYCQSKKKDFL